EFLAPDSLRLIGTPLETFNHFVGEKADSLTLDLRATFAATAVNERGAQTVARSALEEMVCGGLGLIPGSETFERETKTSSDEQGRVTFSIRAAGRVAPTIDVGEVREAVRGQSISTARGNLSEQYELAVPPKIEVWPKWMGRVPWLAMRIEVQVRQSGN
ncbi:MAG: hypothetical protein HY260_05705, partial [Chloroflexi bacterium]|nr:hypothetical protein [Chloroflexota bacterium]